MSQENVEIVRRTFELANEGDLESVVELYAEDAVPYGPEGWPEVGPWRGHGAILEEFRRIWEDFDGEILIEEITTDGDWVLVKHIWRVRGSRSGVSGEFRITLTARVRSATIVEARYYWEHHEALKAVGLEE